MRGIDPAHRERPLFRSPTINRSIILKHRVRADEAYFFDQPLSVSTKVIVPFEQRDLRLGGQSFFVGQRGYLSALADIGHYQGDVLERDQKVLELIDNLPSLDPFLLREHLRNNDIDVADCYFEISPSDKQKMYTFVSNDIRALIDLANSGKGTAKRSSTDKLVSALLSTEVDEKLEPLRLTLRLDHEAFREGVFSWRGFLYYKWNLTNCAEDVKRIAREIANANPHGGLPGEKLRYILGAKRRIIESISRNTRDVNAALKIYDDAYNRLVQHGQPNTFRDFLLGAPDMFLELGEKMGAIAHMTSFWRYRFPKGRRVHADVEEMLAILRDFESSFGLVPADYDEFGSEQYA